MVATKGGAELAKGSLEVRCDKYGATGETIGNSLGTGDEVGGYVKMLMGKELTATAVATLDFVADEHSSRFCTSATESLHKFLGGKANTAHSLDAFYDYGSHISLLKFCLKGCEVVKREEGAMTVGIDGRHNLGVVRSFYGEGGASVKRLLRTEYAVLACVERSEFQGIFIRFST